jgi:hypothetical protein
MSFYVNPLYKTINPLYKCGIGWYRRSGRSTTIIFLRPIIILTSTLGLGLTRTLGHGPITHFIHPPQQPADRELTRTQTLACAALA